MIFNGTEVVGETFVCEEFISFLLQCGHSNQNTWKMVQSRFLDSARVRGESWYESNKGWKRLLRRLKVFWKQKILEISEIIVIIEQVMNG